MGSQTSRVPFPTVLVLEMEPQWRAIIVGTLRKEGFNILRPILSDRKPHSGRVIPFAKLSTEAASVRTGSDSPRIVMICLSTPKSRASGPSWAVITAVRNVREG